MNFPLIARFLGIISLLLGGSMLFSLPWAAPAVSGTPRPEWDGVLGLLGSTALCALVGLVLLTYGRRHRGQLFRKEAMAVVGLSWVMAAVLGAGPYLLSGTQRAPGVPMSAVDALFESQSGFTTTGSTVLTDLEDPELVPRCILFWRSSTHFLGGLGIIVLFVIVLGEGTVGKLLMRAELTGPKKVAPMARIRETAWVVFLIYCGLNAALTLLLWLEGLAWFDALCHAFGTIATGGFSTYNRSVGHFATVPGLNAPLIEMTIVVFMILGGTNFLLLYAALSGGIRTLLADTEWRTYIGLLLVGTLLIIAYGWTRGDFAQAADDTNVTIAGRIGHAARSALFNTASVFTTTGFATADYDRWSPFAHGLLLVIMFVGGCAGSTSGGFKVIRGIVVVKLLVLELERAFRPTVVRPLRIAGQAEPDELAQGVILHATALLLIVLSAWLLLLMVEPDSTWLNAGRDPGDKLIDCISAVGAVLNTTGPGFGVVGPAQTYAELTATSKLVLAAVMLLGRLEVFVVVVLLLPRFWQR